MRLKINGDGSLSYGLSLLGRFFYGLFCLILIIGFISVIKDDGFTKGAFIPIFLFLLSLGGAGYRENWLFNPAEGSVESKIGFLFWTKKGNYRLSDINRITIRHFVRGNPSIDPAVKGRGKNKAMVIFSLEFKDNSAKDIEIIGERVSGGRSEGAALKIATVMGIPFWQDRASER